MPLPLDTDPRTTAYRWLCVALAKDTALKRVVRKWITWDGTPNSGAELPTEPGIVRLTPTFEPEEPHSSDGLAWIYQTAVRVNFEVSHKGSDASDAGNLAGAIFAAAESAHRVDRRTVRESRISWIEPGPPPQAAGENVVAVGSLRLVCFLSR